MSPVSTVFTVVSWNIQSARTRAGAADLDAVAEHLQGFAGADLLCLQEVACGFPNRDGSPGGDQFAGLARRLSGYRAVSALAVDTPGPDGTPRQLGSMLFSRHPILQVLRHTLPWPADPEVMSMPRCALEVTLATPLGPMRVLNVHLEYFSGRQRLAQAERLRALQREACAHARAPRPGPQAQAGPSPFANVPRPSAAVLVGDFNMLPDSPAYARLVSHGGGEGNGDAVAPLWIDAWRRLQPARAHPPTVGLHDRTPGAAALTFDYAFVSPDLAPRVRALRVDPFETGSDHQPLLLELS